jgi:D-glycero-alpha-D-manno-heptose-7-phosphate kinase
MIISRAPVRISLGGGGTDLHSYYSKYGGFLIAGAIDKYIFISANKRFYNTIRLSYSLTEIVNNYQEIKHGIFREALKSLMPDDGGGIELVSVADVPANCGLGSSSSFTVALLNALHAYNRQYISQRTLAEEACMIEIEKLGEPIGKQDQYISAFGGLTTLTFEKDGNVIVEPLKMDDDVIDELERNILLYYTGIERSASGILKEQNEKSKMDESTVIESLHQIKKIGYETKKTFENGDLERFGELLDVHWNMKKQLSTSISNSFIDSCYETALKNGAIGGKIMGAGGGGFFMFYIPDNHDGLTRAMKEKGLRPMKFRFDFEGAKILVNMKH